MSFSLAAVEYGRWGGIGERFARRLRLPQLVPKWAEEGRHHQRADGDAKAAAQNVSRLSAVYLKCSCNSGGIAINPIHQIRVCKLAQPSPSKLFDFLP